MATENGHRGRMMAEAILFCRMIEEHKGGSIRVEEIAAKMQISIRGAYRWIDAMRGCLDIEVRHREVYVPNETTDNE